ncbi:hypothetical protein ABZP36_029434 [Zizania latifolia]
MVDSLSRVLHAFYPLAGRVRRTPGENKYELFYQPGDSVVFTVAEYDGVGVDELATNDPREVTKITQFLPNLPEGDAVLALQVTVPLPERRGLSLGVTVHHSACDGVGSTHFLHTWATACAGAKVPPEPPVIDRTVIHDRKEIHDVFTSPMNDAKELFKSRLFAADLRTRLEPTVPGKYLGNCVGPSFALAPKKELTATDAGGLFTACATVAAAIDEVVRAQPPY